MRQFNKPACELICLTGRHAARVAAPLSTLAAEVRLGRRTWLVNMREQARAALVAGAF